MRKIFNVVLVAAAISVMCFGAPEPKVVLDAPGWTLDVEFEPLGLMVVKVDGQNRRFWYEIFSVVNNTGDDVEFYPVFELVTDTFQTIPDGKDVPLVVYNKIKKRHSRRYPFLETADQVGHRIMEGEDNRRDILVVWPDFQPDAKVIQLFAKGFSNETAAVDHPVQTDPNGQPAKVYLRKALELTYSFGGDPKMRSNARITYEGKNWVLR